MRRGVARLALAIGLTLGALAVAPIAVVSGAPKKPAVKPKPKPTTDPNAAPTWVEDKPDDPPAPKGKEKEKEKPGASDDDAEGDGGTKGGVELAACPASSVLDELEPKALVTLVRKKCRTLKVPTTATPTEISTDDLLVALCVRAGDVITPKECNLAASLLVSTADGVTALQFVEDGELALSLTASRIDKAASPDNGTRFTLMGGIEGGKQYRAPLVWSAPVRGYGHGLWFWFPLPMLTTDLSASPQGYRLGITPVAVAVGAKFAPSGLSTAYLGTSAFLAWNVLVPNDTQTLSNGTQVRINYKAMGAGVLVDAAGFVSLGLGVGHTFTADARTDFRLWLYFGPRLLGAIGF
ncbi:MAG: hypothetical protein ABI175_20235 [Polyangiales bacterium]